MGLQQLYKDVDSDHQQKLLYSNIYIPEDVSDGKYDAFTNADSEAQRGAPTNVHSQGLTNYYRSQQGLAAFPDSTFNRYGSKLDDVHDRKMAFQQLQD